MQCLERSPGISVYALLSIQYPSTRDAAWGYGQFTATDSRRVKREDQDGLWVNAYALPCNVGRTQIVGELWHARTAAAEKASLW